MKLGGSVRATTAALVAVAAAVLGVGCTNAGTPPTITVGAGDSAQSELIAEIYAQALSRTGAKVVTRKHLGQRADYLAALDAGTVTLVGDTDGDLLRSFDSSSHATSPDQATDARIADEHTPPPVDMSRRVPGAPLVLTSLLLTSVADDLSRALPEGLAVSDIADGADLRAQLVLGPAAASRYPADLKNLAPHCAELSVGIAGGRDLDPLRTPPDPQRDVVDRLHTAYGCDITRHTEFRSDAELRDALRDGRVDAGVFTASAALLPGGPGDLTVVADPNYAFRAQNVVPLLRQGALDERQLKKLNYVAGELTTAEFTELIRRVRDEHASAADLARNWLDEHGL